MNYRYYLMHSCWCITFDCLNSNPSLISFVCVFLLIVKLLSLTSPSFQPSSPAQPQPIAASRPSRPTPLPAHRPPPAPVVDDKRGARLSSPTPRRGRAGLELEFNSAPVPAARTPPRAWPARQGGLPAYLSRRRTP
jgi:hypothetical protein